MMRYFVHTFLLLMMSILVWILLSSYVSNFAPSKDTSSLVSTILRQLPNIGGENINPNPNNMYQEYVPAEMEAYEIEHAESQGYNLVSNYDPLNVAKSADKMPSGCLIWQDTKHPFYPKARTFLDELESYYQDIRNFNGTDDVRHQFTMDLSNRDKVCSQLDL